MEEEDTPTTTSGTDDDEYGWSTGIDGSKEETVGTLLLVGKDEAIWCNGLSIVVWKLPMGKSDAVSFLGKFQITLNLFFYVHYHG